MSAPVTLKSLQRQVWGGRIALEIRLSPGECRSYDRSDPYLVEYIHPHPPPSMISPSLNTRRHV